MSQHTFTKEQFIEDVSKHKMTVLKDDGLYRHVRFRRPDSGTYCFDLVTWPGYLSISGDMGNWVFKRIDDMFDFFDPKDHGDLDGLSINGSYWCEKITSETFASTSSFAKSDFNRPWLKYDHKATIEEITKDINEDIDEDGTTQEDIEDLIDDLHSCEENPESILEFLDDNDIEDGYEYINYTATYHIQWILHAIVWGILEYKKTKTKI